MLLKFISYRKINGEKPSEDLLHEIVNGDYFVRKNLLNYSSPDYYNFVIEIIPIRNLFSNLLTILCKNPKIEKDFDFIKMIYEELFPKELRHSMGEFYTPDWLAEITIAEIIKNDKTLEKRKFFDPTCGSGTFLFSLLRILENKKVTLQNNIFGVDINPLAVLAAKTNFILFFKNPNKKDVLLPFFNTDIIKHPKYTKDETTLFNAKTNLYSISIDSNTISVSIKKYKLGDISALYRAIIDNNSSRLSLDVKIIFEQISKLSRNEQIHFIDRLSLLSLDDMDYIIGNPPWVNWEYLPKDYRKATESVWQYYELFDYKGINSIFIKEDISALVTYVAVDNHLKDKGKIGFILKESLFKSAKQGAGFRKFYIPRTKECLYPYAVHDLTRFSPFAGVNNKTFILFLSKNESFSYPTSFIEWVPSGKKTFNEFEKMETVLGSFKFEKKLALPLDKNDVTSGWITIDKNIYAGLSNYLGKPSYKARTGVFTGGANAIFWLRILNHARKNNIEIENITERAKNKMKKVNTTLEPEYVFPLVTGSDISFWHFEYSRYILLPHTKESKMYPINPHELDKYPLTKKYFEKFKKDLEERKGFTSFDKKIHLDYYYSLQRIGEYTFEPYKVAWRYIAKEFTPCVIESVTDKYLGKKNLIPNEKIIYIGLSDKAEAYYLCGLLSSKIIREIINSFTVSIQIAPSTINNIKLPQFDKDNLDHQKISMLCMEGHKSQSKEEYVLKIDKLVQKMYQAK